MKALLRIALCLIVSTNCLAPAWVYERSVLDAHGPVNGNGMNIGGQHLGVQLHGALTAITHPLYVSEIPRGKANITVAVGCYGAFILLSFCWGDPDMATKNLSSPMVAVHSVDEQYSQYYLYSGRILKINGWNRDDWIKEFGSLSTIPTTAALFNQNIELKDGRRFEGVMVRTESNSVTVLESTGLAHHEDSGNIARVF